MSDQEEPPKTSEQVNAEGESSFEAKNEEIVVEEQTAPEIQEGEIVNQSEDTTEIEESKIDVINQDGESQQNLQDGAEDTKNSQEPVGEDKVEEDVPPPESPEKPDIQEVEQSAEVVEENVDTQVDGEKEPDLTDEERQKASSQSETQVEEIPMTEVESENVVTEQADESEPIAAVVSEVQVDTQESVVMQVPVEEPESALLMEETLPQPGTPEKQGSVVDGEEILMPVEEEEEEEPKYSREDLVQQYQAAVQERDQLNQQNRNLQHKLSEYFRKKKTDDPRQEMDKSNVDQEQRYMKYMGNLEELHHQQAAEMETFNELLEEMLFKKTEKQAKVEEELKKSIEFKRTVALEAINSRTGRPIPPKDLEVYEANERKKELEVSQVRLENIKLKNRLKKQENLLKQKEELAEGLHLIDFEQLKIENQTYNEKIEERNEELLKLRKKITNTVQVLTHLKEKLQFVQAENTLKKDQLSIVEREVAQKRDILSRTKQARDNLRHENNKFQQKCGLLGNTDLLRDFEISTDEVTELEHKLDLLKRTHAELTLSLNGIKKKIELARDTQS